MLDLAGTCRGQRVLDIATGRGEPALRAAARVAPEGVVVGTDRSSDMLEFARKRAAEMGIANLTLEATNAETLEAVPEGNFDIALCRWGLMYFDHPRRALAALRRRLAPGGVFVAAVWAEPARVPYWSMPRDVLARHAPVPPVYTVASGTFHYAPAERLREDLASAGFSIAHEEELSTPVMEAATPGGLIEWCLAFGLARMLATHPPSVRDAWLQDMAVEAARHRDTDGMYRLGGVTRVVAAHVPGDRR
jgi:ubiquinone/menaquinone biosynthesis C-methylase UbiE